MASAQWDEEEYVNVNSLDPLYKFDTHFPDRLGRYKVSSETKSPSPRANKRGRDRNLARFKTQPITFDEIKEVDEESAEDTKEGLRSQFAAFSRSMDGLVPGFPVGAIVHPAARDVRVTRTVTAPIIVKTSPPTSPCDSPDGNISMETTENQPPDTAKNNAMDFGHIHPRRKKKHAKVVRRTKTEGDEEACDTNNGNAVS